MIHGILNVYKEKGYTSHDVVAKLRGIAGQKKIGHTGTLDPDATGVLPVCLGKATKVCELLTDRDKTYEAVLLLGCETDTQDTSGEVLRQCETGYLKEADVRETILGFVGAYAQIPPMYSALKVGGKKLCDLAREGIIVERKARTVQIHQLEILKMDLPRVWIRVECSKGTYIRTLCHDIGQKLGCGGCMEQLVRTRVGSFRVEQALTLAQIKEAKEQGELEALLTPVDGVFAAYPAVEVKAGWEKPAYNGGFLPMRAVDRKEKGIVRMYNQKEQFIGLYRCEEERHGYQLVKMFYSADTEG